MPALRLPRNVLPAVVAAAACLAFETNLLGQEPGVDSLPRTPKATRSETPQAVQAARLVLEQIRAKQLPNDTVAVFDGGIVTKQDYWEWLLFRSLEDRPAQRESHIAKIALVKARATQARDRGLHVDPELAAALWKREAGTLANALRVKIAADIEISESDLFNAIEQRRHTFGQPPRRKLRNLLKRFPTHSDEQLAATTEATVAQWRARLLSGESFEELAKQESDSQTRFRGGLIGWVRRGDLAPEVDAIAFSLKPGELSQPLRTKDGYGLLLCEEVAAAKPASEEQIRSKVLSSLKRERFAQQWLQFEREALAVLIRTDFIEDPTITLSPQSGSPPVLVVANTPVDAALARALVGSSEQDFALLQPPEREARLREFLEQVLAAEEANRLGLKPNMENAVRLAWAKTSELATAQLRQQIKASFEPLTDSDVKAFFEANRGQFRRPTQTEIHAIQWPVTRSTLRTATDTAQRVQQALTSKAISFEQAAKEYSRHPSREVGGALGWLSQRDLGILGPNVVMAVEGQPPGTIGDLVLQPIGLDGRAALWLFRKGETREAGLLTYSEAQDNARELLGSKRTERLEGSLNQKLLQDLQLRIAPDFAVLEDAPQRAHPTLEY